MIEINTNNFYQLYKEILDTCNKDKIILPFILTEFQIPEMFDYTMKEHNDLDKKYKHKDETMRLYIKRRIDTYRIINGKVDVDKKLNDYYEKELKDFIKKYPKFKSIII